MTGKVTGSSKNMKLFSGRAHPELAEAVAKELKTDLVPTTARDFANGEIFIRFEESVRGADCFVMQSHTQPLNKWLVEQLIMIDALKRGSAKRITAILPFYPYARQDKKHLGREPISARLVADLLQAAGADRIVSVDLHTDQIQGFFDGPVDHMHAQPILTDYIKSKYATDNITVVSPDAGRVKVAEKWAHDLGDAPLAFVHKTRSNTEANKTVSNRVVGDVEGKDCVLLIPPASVCLNAVRRKLSPPIPCRSPPRAGLTSRCCPSHRFWHRPSTRSSRMVLSPPCLTAPKHDLLSLAAENLLRRLLIC